MSQSDVHASDDLLAAHAVGEAIPVHMQRHVDSCPTCSAELERWRNLVAATQGTSDLRLTEPPPSVWTGIVDELALAPGHLPRSDAETARARRWPTAILVAASIGGVLLGAVVTLGGVLVVDDDGEPSPPVAAPSSAVVATTDLVALPEHSGAGSVEIVRTDTGRELVVDVTNLSEGQGFYEVWLIDPKTFEMVGLGALNSTSGRFPIPDGLDVRQYRVVDVSLEPFDGDPAHSRDSVVRGELPA